MAGTNTAVCSKLGVDAIVLRRIVSAKSKADVTAEFCGDMIALR